MSNSARKVQVTSVGRSLGNSTLTAVKIKGEEPVSGHIASGRSSLRNIQSVNDKKGASPLTAISRAVNQAVAEVALLISPKTANSMCTYYGHVINHKTWKRGLPKCAECGILVDNPKMLRSSNAH